MALTNISATLIGDKELARTLERMSSLDIPKAIKGGVKYAARGGGVAISKNVGALYALKSARIKQDISKPQFTQGGLTAIIRTSRKPITAMQFKPKERRKGISLSIFRGKRTFVKSGFIAKGLPFRRKGKERMPLDVIHGPSLHAVFTGGKHSQAITQATEQRIGEQLEKGILRELGRIGRGFGG